jgi:hypothetical protein
MRLSSIIVLSAALAATSAVAFDGTPAKPGPVILPSKEVSAPHPQPPQPTEPWYCHDCPRGLADRLRPLPPSK